MEHKAIIENIDLLKLLLSRLDASCDSILVSEIIESILYISKYMVYDINNTDNIYNALRELLLKCVSDIDEVETMIYMCSDIAKYYISTLTITGILNESLYVIEVNQTNIVIGVVHSY